MISFRPFSLRDCCYLLAAMSALYLCPGCQRSATSEPAPSAPSTQATAVDTPAGPQQGSTKSHLVQTGQQPLQNKGGPAANGNVPPAAPADRPKVSRTDKEPQGSPAGQTAGLAPSAGPTAKDDVGGRRPSRYQVVPLEVMGSDKAMALRINSEGTVVGYRHVGRGTLVCVWNKDGKLAEGLSGRGGMAQGINDKGQIVGGLGLDEVTPFVYDGKQPRSLPVDGIYVAAIAADINENGAVAGIAIHAARGPQAAIFNDDGVRILGTLGGPGAEVNAIGPENQVVGEAPTAAGIKHAFLWSDGRMTDLGTLGGEQSVAQQINASGLIVGMAEDENGYGRACVWENRRIRDVGVLPGGSQSWAFGCNRHGQICGWSQVINNQQHGVLWHDGRAIDLNDLITDSGSWLITDARAISDGALIAAAAEHEGRTRPVLLIPTFGQSGPGVASATPAVKEGIAIPNGKANSGAQEGSSPSKVSGWPSRRPMGRWIDETTYANDFVTPFRVKLPRGWRNEKPAGEPGLHVLSTDNTVATDPRVELDPAQLSKAFVVWSLAESTSSADMYIHKIGLGVEIEAMPSGRSFEEFVTARIERQVRENSRRYRPDLHRLDPLVRTGETWVHGRRCRTCDFDGFYGDGGFSMRTYFIEAAGYVVSFVWMFTNPSERSAIAERMTAMVELGPPLTPQQPADPKALPLHEAVCQALDQAAKETPLAELSTALRDKEMAQIVLISRAHAAIDGLNQRTSEDRVGDFGRAVGARSIADAGQREIASLRVEYNMRLLQAAWQKLTPADQALAKSLRPDFSQAAQGSAAPSVSTQARPADAKDGWLPVQFPGSPITIDMPGTPKLGADGAYELKLAGPAATLTFVVKDLAKETGMSEKDISAQPGMMEQLFTVISQALINHSSHGKGQLTGTSSVSLQGHPGRDYVWSFRSDDTQKVGHARFFLADRNMIIVGVTRPADAAFESQEKTFFDSLRIVSK